MLFSHKVPWFNASLIVPYLILLLGGKANCPTLGVESKSEHFPPSLPPPPPPTQIEQNPSQTKQETRCQPHDFIRADYACCCLPGTFCASSRPRGFFRRAKTHPPELLGRRKPPPAPPRRTGTGPPGQTSGWRLEARLQCIASFFLSYCGWTKSHSHHCKSRMMRSCKYSRHSGFVMVSKRCRISSTHSMSVAQEKRNSNMGCPGKWNQRLKPA